MDVHVLRAAKEASDDIAIVLSRAALSCGKLFHLGARNRSAMLELLMINIDEYTTSAECNSGRD